ncbi:MAG: sodium:solute symporter [Bacteroidetes bacterium]|nr:sodium:solute symporter [Bacteroidota bacterium]
MDPKIILICLAVYFVALLVISYITSRKSTNETFYTADHKSPWYIVAFGLIGTSISGVSLVSVTGKVTTGQWGYMQMVLGFFAGYVVISYLLLPLYYRLKLTSIYNYLEIRFGIKSRSAGSFYFILSRSLGAAVRLYLAAIVMQDLVFKHFGIPIELTLIIVLLLIFLYTFQSGIKTIIWTDTLQSALLIIGIVVSIFSIKNLIGSDFTTIFKDVHQAGLTTIFNDGFSGFLKSFISGMFICITMTGLDQGMMQRSLSCPNLKDAQKNIMSFSVVLIIINFMFLFIGAMLAIYMFKNGIIVDKTDSAFPEIANKYFPPLASVMFILSMIAATFSGADDALAALTTSFCLDILKLDTTTKKANITRKLVHLGFAALMFFIIVLFFIGSQKAVIDLVYNIAAVTYAPLLGMFAFGILTKKTVNDISVAVVSFAAPIIMLIVFALVGLYKETELVWTDLLQVKVLLALVFKTVGNEIIFYISGLVFVLLYMLSDDKKVYNVLDEKAIEHI